VSVDVFFKLVFVFFSIVDDLFIFVFLVILIFVGFWVKGFFDLTSVGKLSTL